MRMSDREYEKAKYHLRRKWKLSQIESDRVMAEYKKQKRKEAIHDWIQEVLIGIILFGAPMAIAFILAWLTGWQY